MILRFVGFVLLGAASASLVGCGQKQVLPESGDQVYLICEAWSRPFDKDGSAPSIYRFSINEAKGFSSILFASGLTKSLESSFQPDSVTLVNKEEKNTYFRFRGEIIPTIGGDEYLYTINRNDGSFLLKKRQGGSFDQSMEARGGCKKY